MGLEQVSTESEMYMCFKIKFPLMVLCVRLVLIAEMFAVAMVFIQY